MLFKYGMQKVIFLTLLTVFTCSRAQAWEFRRGDGGVWVHPASNNINFHLNTQSFPVGPARDAFIQALTSWERTPAALTLTTTFGDEELDGERNKRNDVYFTSEGFAPGQMAVTYSWYHSSTGEIIKSDIAFNANIPYTSSLDIRNLRPYGGSEELLQNVAIHEIGHLLGLGHTPDNYSVMGLATTHTAAVGTT